MRSNAAELDARSARPARARTPDITLELLSSIAHELRTPLSTLSASAEMLQAADVDTQQRFAAIIQRQAQRLNYIVEGLLESYRASQGHLRLRREIVEVEDLLVELCAEQEAMFPRHRWIMEVEAGHRVNADRRALAMALTNLMSNAAKYSPAGSTVRVATSIGNGVSEIRVEDQGPGVPEFLRLRIFRAGERGLIDGAAGCGLGLFIAQQLCTSLGAELDITDTRDGGGSCFVISLPD
jgi:signal transduction histidine kinase